MTLAYDGIPIEYVGGGTDSAYGDELHILGGAR